MTPGGSAAPTAPALRRPADPYGIETAKALTRKGHESVIIETDKTLRTIVARFQHMEQRNKTMEDNPMNKDLFAVQWQQMQGVWKSRMAAVAR